MKNKNKKTAPPWYIATTHYLTAGFVPGIICGGIGAVLVHFFTADSPFLSQTIFALLVPVAAYIGVRYSARYVERAYVLTAAPRVAALASVYYGIIQCCGVLAIIYFVIRSSFPEGLILVMVIAATQALAGFTVFFAMSASCLKNDPPSSTFDDPSITAGLFPTHYTPPPQVSSAVVPQPPASSSVA